MAHSAGAYPSFPGMKGQTNKQTKTIATERFVFTVSRKLEEKNCEKLEKWSQLSFKHLTANQYFHRVPVTVRSQPIHALWRITPANVEPTAVQPAILLTSRLL